MNMEGPPRHAAKIWLGVVAHICNPSTFEKLMWVNRLRSGVQDQPGQHGETLSLLQILFFSTNERVES